MTFATALEHKIRFALEPDHSAIIRQYLDLVPTNYSNDITLQRLYFVSQCSLLTETITDELLPAHWRCQCLDHFYLPLGALSRLADNDTSRAQVLSISYEMQIVVGYIQAGLVV
jgi:hypothetical protein|tara:strand:+ start:228 stop:569 length:342 start_codon:yes stop_codon:yes gene_type:complete